MGRPTPGTWSTSAVSPTQVRACCASRQPAVEPNGRITPGDLGLWDDATEAAFKPVLAGVRQYSKIAVAIQLAHAGRKGSSRGALGGRPAHSGVRGWLAKPCAVSGVTERRAAGKAAPDVASLIRATTIDRRTGDEFNLSGVCTENLIRIDCVTESPKRQRR